MRLASCCGSSYLVPVHIEIAYNTPQLIPDGLLVTGGHLIRNHVTTWVVQVVVESPQSNDDLMQQIHRLRDLIISAVLPQRRVSNMTKGSWLQRIRVMEDQVIQLDMEHIHTTRNITRAKRGLFDFGGIVRHKVFGLAKTAELMESRRWIEQVRTNNIRVTCTVSLIPLHELDVCPESSGFSLELELPTEIAYDTVGGTMYAYMSTLRHSYGVSVILASLKTSAKKNHLVNMPHQWRSNFHRAFGYM